MIVRLGYVAMSKNLQNASPSQTMTYSHFQTIRDREAAIKKLERIARSNLHNILRILKHNAAHDIRFFRMSSRIVPLARHEALKDWNPLVAIQQPLEEIGTFAKDHHMRIDFHPEHFVLFSSKKKDVLQRSIQSLRFHHDLLSGMNVNPVHRSVIHVGGSYGDKERALERWVHNWMYVPSRLQQTVMLENDDTTFHVEDVLYLCEKLNLPCVFDLHHHSANPPQSSTFEAIWERIAGTWKHSPLPLKMHVSSPKSQVRFRDHADFIEAAPFMDFLRKVKGSVSQIDCMLEAKAKDNALFRLMEDVRRFPDVTPIDGASFELR
ncbi:MAG TPA: UV DNA damage repair endonuclease UvsE [Bacillales bacterium]|nr:UV DNA damage repair endonuclease UvsE [Bacillales bacterium]